MIQKNARLYSLSLLKFTGKVVVGTLVSVATAILSVLWVADRAEVLDVDWSDFNIAVVVEVAPVEITFPPSVEAAARKYLGEATP